MPVKNDIIKQLQDLLYGPLWLDESFQKKIGDLQEEAAFIRPLPDIHSVAELVSHLTVWIGACIDRMNCVPNTLKDNNENDWKSNEELRQKGWPVLKEEFFKAHARLMEYAETCDELFLNRQYQASDFTNKDILFGLIQHDAYHLGQIGITLKLLKTSGRVS